MPRIFSKTTLFAAISCVFLSNNANASIFDSFDCGDQAAGINLVVSIRPPEGRAVINRNNQQISLVPDGQGAWVNPGEEIQFYPDSRPSKIFLGSEQFDCRLIVAENETENAASPRNAIKLNVPGRSLGGKLREGPGIDFLQVGSLRENDPILIVNNSGVMFNGYPWFQIVHSDGRTAYQWGGIMCSENKAVQGVFQICGR